MDGDEICRTFDRHSVENVTLGKYVAVYEQTVKCMVKFLSKFLGRGSKITRVNSIRVVKPLIFFNILRSLVR